MRTEACDNYIFPKRLWYIRYIRYILPTPSFRHICFIVIKVSFQADMSEISDIAIHQFW